MQVLWLEIHLVKFLFCQSFLLNNTLILHFRYKCWYYESWGIQIICIRNWISPLRGIISHFCCTDNLFPQSIDFSTATFHISFCLRAFILLVVKYGWNSLLCVPRKNNTFPLFYSIQVLLSAVFWACRTKIMEMLCAQLLFKMKQKKEK